MDNCCRRGGGDGKFGLRGLDGGILFGSFFGHLVERGVAVRGCGREGVGVDVKVLHDGCGRDNSHGVGTGASGAMA